MVGLELPGTPAAIEGSDFGSRQRTHVLDEGPDRFCLVSPHPRVDPVSGASVGLEHSAHQDNDVTGERPESSTNVALAPLTKAETHADLGLPVGASERFRLVKRLLAKVSWPFLRHQIAFNHALIQSNRELAERMARLQERIEQDLRTDLLDFADRSVSQAHAEIGDHVAESSRIRTELILELRSLQAELNTMIETVARALPPESVPEHREGRGEVAEVDNSAHESYR